MTDSQPDNLVLQLLRDMREDMATKIDIARIDTSIADLRSEINSLRADVASDIHALDAKIDVSRQDLSDKIAGLRRSVMEYHSSAVGHGVLFTEIEERLKRVEQRPGMENH